MGLVFLLALSNFTKEETRVAATIAVDNRDEPKWLKVVMSRILTPLWGRELTSHTASEM